MSARRFQDKVAIVTGGCQGLGRACVEVLVENGGKVAVFDVKDDIGSKMQADGPGEIFYLHCDVTKEDDIKKSIETVAQRFGKIDCLVNNVGTHPGFDTIDGLSVDGFRELCEINLISNFAMSKYTLPHLRKSKGSIVNMSSILATAAAKQSSTYVATKGGVRSLTKALAVDEAKYGVRVNSIAPSVIETELFIKVVPEEQRGKFQNFHTLGRLGQPREVGLACLFLAEDATFTTGEELLLSGGSEIGYGVKD